jgi:hypothetical protein
VRLRIREVNVEKTTIEENIVKNGFHLSTVVGDSMMPLLRQGKDLVKVVPVEKPLKKYDVVLFKRPTGEYVLHRIVKVKRDYYAICGDNRFLREKIPMDWIIGMAESVFIDDEEVMMSDERQLNYARNICRTFWSRRIKSKLKRILQNR